VIGLVEKLSINLPQGTIATLDALQKANRAVTRSEVLRRALTLGLSELAREGGAAQ